MKTWFNSLNNVISLSAIALLVFLWTVLLDWRYVYGPMTLSMVGVGLGALGYTAYLGVWMWGLLAATRGKRGGLIAAPIFALLLVAYAILDLIVYCPTSCVKWPVYYIANGLNLVAGLLAVVAIGSHLRLQPKAAGSMERDK